MGDALIMVISDTAQQREHDRKVAEAAVAKARIEWEKEFLQSQKQSRIQVIAAPTAASASTPAKTIIESMKDYLTKKCRENI